MNASSFGIDLTPGATSALDADTGSEAESLANEIDENKVRDLQPDGSFK